MIRTGCPRTADGRSGVDAEPASQPGADTGEDPVAARTGQAAEGTEAAWLDAERARGAHLLGVELADEAVRLGDLPAARRRTVLVLGHESHGIPPEGMDRPDGVVEIPMIGSGHSLNVAVAGSQVLYKLAGLP